MAKLLDSGIVELDLMDKKILHQLDLNARAPVSIIAKNIHASRTIVEYRINKLLELGVIRCFSTQIDPAKFGLSSWKVYLRLHNLTKEKENEMLSFLAGKKQVWWVVKSYGAFALLYSAIGESYYEFYRVLIEFHDRFGEFILEEAINNHLEVEFSSRGYLLMQESRRICEPFLVKPVHEKVDEIDLMILKTIALNARLSVFEIARLCNISPRIVDYRLKDLIKRKIIVFFRLVLDANRIGRDYYKGIVYLKNSSSKNLQKLCSYCESHAKIHQWGKTVGPWQFEFEMEVEDFKEYNKVMEELLNKFPEMIVRIDPMLLYKEINPEYNFLNYVMH